MDVIKTRLIWGVLVLFLFAGFLDSCKRKEKGSAKEISIQINLTGVDQPNYVFLKELNVRDVKTHDSVRVTKDGTISFLVKPEDAGFYLVVVRDNNLLTLQADPGETIIVNADYKDIQKDYKVSGSPGSSILKSFFDKTRRQKLKVDSLGEIFNRAKESPEFAKVREQLDVAYKQIFNDQRNFTESLIRKNPAKLTSVFLLNQSFGPSLLFKETDNLELFRFVDNAVFSKYPVNKHVVDHHHRVNDIIAKQTVEAENDKRLSVGKPAPEIKLDDLTGKNYILSSQAGKVTILCFWQSMCGKCRRDNLTLRDFLKVEKPYGLNLWMISLDENPEMTMAALKLDKVGGVEFNVKGGLNAPLSMVYNITQDLPVYYVIGRDGKIAAKGDSFEVLKDTILHVLASKK